MALDYRTVVFLLSAMNLMLTAAMVYAWRVSTRVNGTAHWAAGYACSSLGVLFFGLNLELGFPTFLILSFVSQLTSAELLVRGCGEYTKRPVPRIASASFLAAGIAVGGATGLIQSGFPGGPELHRAAGYMAFAAIFYRGGLRFLRRPYSGKLSPSTLGTAVSFFGAAGLHLYVPVNTVLFRSSLPSISPLLFQILFSFLLVGLALALLQLGYDRYHETLKSQAEEKTLLLREMHHRTKNNLALTASLISLESAGIEDARTRKALEELEDRVRAIALLHQMLQDAEGARSVPAGEYLRNVAESAARSVRDNIAMDCEIDPVELPASEAIPMGLILNELVTNAVKHAFPDGRAGKIRVRLADTEGVLELAVEDDGVGMPGNPGKHSLGLPLVQSLADQLKGSLRFEKGPGTRVVVRVPAPRG